MPNLIESLLGKCRFPEPKAKVNCAVSGGADSLAMMALAIKSGCEVTAIHVDHGLRPDSIVESDLVREVAHKLGAEFISKSVVVKPGPNLEARARSARYAVLPSDVLTGHTADDQAETVLLNLMRGAGLSGISGMRIDGHPILRLRRRETKELCNSLGLNFFEDPSNRDLTILRNRVRLQLIPLMNEIAGRDVAEIIARQTEILRADSDFLEQLAQDLDATDARVVAAEPYPLSARAIRQWLRKVIDEETHPPSAATVERVLEVARGNSVACEIEGGKRVFRKFQKLHVGDLKGNQN